MRLPRFEYISPKSLQEVRSLLNTYRGQARVLAGGTDLLVDLKKPRGSLLDGKVPRYIIGLRGIPSFKSLRYESQVGLRIGAMATFNDVAGSEEVKEKHPLLWHACRIFSRPQIRHAGTLIGNLCNASPSADIVPPLIALDAKARIVSVEAERTVAVVDFCRSPFKTVLNEGELVAELEIPPAPQPYGWSYQRTTKRTAEDEALVIVAIQLQLAESDRLIQKASIALGSVAPRPIKAIKAETMM